MSRTTNRTHPNRDKKRTAKAKAKRLAHEEKRIRLSKKAKASMGECRIRLLKDGTDGDLVFGIQRGILGHPTTSLVRVPVEAVAGALEDQKELGTIVFKVGVVALSHMIGYNLAYGVDGLAKALAEWAGVDLAALEAAVAEESAEAGGGLTDVKTDLGEQDPQSSGLPEQLELPFDTASHSETLARLGSGDLTPGAA